MTLRNAVSSCFLSSLGFCQTHWFSVIGYLFLNALGLTFSPHPHPRFDFSSFFFSSFFSFFKRKKKEPNLNLVILWGLSMEWWWPNSTRNQVKFLKEQACGNSRGLGKCKKANKKWRSHCHCCTIVTVYALRSLITPACIFYHWHFGEFVMYFYLPFSTQQTMPWLFKLRRAYG